MIKGTEGMTVSQLHEELRNGAKFVVYQYAISIVVMTFRNSSEIHFVRKGESTIGKSIGYTLLTLVMGWWGIPWGPIYSIGAIVNNLSGGKDVTAEVMRSVSQPPPPAPNAPRPGEPREFRTPPSLHQGGQS